MSPDLSRFDRVRAVRFADSVVHLLDQRLLPAEQIELRCETVAAVAQAITDLVVRGAPAIGITAAYGAAMAARQRLAEGGDFHTDWQTDLALLGAARPTAVNLVWAIEQVRNACAGLSAEDVVRVAQETADEIARADLAANYRMAELGAQLIEAGSGVLTHCNTGSLATGGLGTALGVVRAGVASGKVSRVYAAETRPWLQGARLTLWELMQDGIEVQLVADGGGAWLISQGKVQWVIVGADRVCANGDVANKIGTLAHACAARQFGAKFMVVAPWSTVDLGTASGDLIEIEQRDPNELLSYRGTQVAPDQARAYNPVFDVTPARLVDALVTERGVIIAPDTAKISALAD